METDLNRHRQLLSFFIVKIRHSLKSEVFTYTTLTVRYLWSTHTLTV